MKWIHDETGRFKQRPYYDNDEMDIVCDSLITEFLSEKYGAVKMPLRTGDIESIIELHTSDFDPYADLSNEGDEIEGVTYFMVNAAPIVRISGDLATHYWQENRRRTTLAHELGHVIYHADLVDQNISPIENDDRTKQIIRCNRQNISTPQKTDWLEWQAFYAAGAYLMPISHVRHIAQEILDLIKLDGPFLVDSSPGRGFISRTSHSCQVSSIAAKVRLIQLGYLTEKMAIATIY